MLNKSHAKRILKRVKKCRKMRKTSSKTLKGPHGHGLFYDQGRGRCAKNVEKCQNTFEIFQSPNLSKVLTAAACFMTKDGEDVQKMSKNAKNTFENSQRSSRPRLVLWPRTGKMRKKCRKMPKTLSKSFKGPHGHGLFYDQGRGRCAKNVEKCEKYFRKLSKVLTAAACFMTKDGEDVEDYKKNFHVQYTFTIFFLLY